MPGSEGPMQQKLGTHIQPDMIWGGKGLFTTAKSSEVIGEATVASWFTMLYNYSIVMLEERIWWEYCEVLYFLWSM